MQLQRFGRGDEVYLTVWGPKPPESVSIDVDADPLGSKAKPSFSEVVSETPVKVVKSSEGWTLTLSMEKGMTRVIKIH